MAQSETPGSSGEVGARQNPLSRPLTRLWGSRWILGAASVALLAAVGAAGGSLLTALAGILFVAAVAALLPRSGETGSGEGTASDPARFTTADLVAAVRDPVIVVDRHASVVEANAAARAAFRSLAPGASLSLRFRSPEMQRLFGRLADGDFEGMEAEYLERVPIERLYRVHATPAGKSGLSVLVFRDQSETRRLDRMRADFVANASHELRTPLASIAGFIETLRGSARHDAARRDEFLEIMQGQTVRMAR